MHEFATRLTHKSHRIGSPDFYFFFVFLWQILLIISGGDRNRERCKRRADAQDVGAVLFS